jgi:hypothetical protein
MREERKEKEEGKERKALIKGKGRGRWRLEPNSLPPVHLPLLHRFQGALSPMMDERGSWMRLRMGVR